VRFDQLDLATSLLEPSGGIGIFERWAVPPASERQVHLCGRLSHREGALSPRDGQPLVQVRGRGLGLLGGQ
jgi:hypothetical protein